MTRVSDERALELLRAAMPRVDVNRALDDLWPAVRRRIDERRVSPSVFDLVLAAVVVLLCLMSPSVTSIVLLHF